MKTYRIKAVRESDEEQILNVLQDLQKQGVIVFEEEHPSKESTPATEEQVQEIIDEAELGPYYSEQEAKRILHL